MRPNGILLSGIACLAFFAACAKTTSPGGSAPALGKIAAVPQITDPVVGNLSSTPLASAFQLLPGQLSPTALLSSTTTPRPRLRGGSGILLADWSQPFGASTSWSAADSRADCQSGENIEQAFLASAAPGEASCLIGQVDAANGGPVTFTSGTTLATASPNYVIFTGAEAGSGKLFKILLTKDGNGNINGLQGYSCTGGAGNWNQQSYFDFSLNGTSGVATAHSMVVGPLTYNGYTYTLSEYAEATGTLSGNQWQTKNIDLVTSVSGTDTYSSVTNIAQGATSQEMSAWATGTCTHSGISLPFTVQTIGVSGLSGTGLQSYAIGDGSALWAGTWNGVTVNNGVVDSWTGSTGQKLTPASAGTYYTLVANATLPTMPTTPTASISFGSVTFPQGGNLTLPDALPSGGYTWDCTYPESVTPTTIDIDPSTTTLPLLIQAGLAQCEDNYSFGSSTNPGYVDCHVAD